MTADDYDGFSKEVCDGNTKGNENCTFAIWVQKSNGDYIDGDTASQMVTPKS